MKDTMLYTTALLLVAVIGCSGEQDTGVQDPAARPLLRAKGGVVKGQPRPAARPQPKSGDGRSIELFSVAFYSKDVREASVSLGFQPMPLLTHRFHQNNAQKRYDESKYRRKMWQTEHDIGMPMPVTDWAARGIPPGYTGWVDVDYENWGYEPVLFPERFTDEEIDFRVDEYQRIAQLTRELRPGIKVCLHGVINQAHKPRQREIAERMCANYDAISPAVFPRMKEGCPDVRKMLAVLRNRVAYAVDLRERTGIKVFPVVWKRYHVKSGPHKGEKLMMPPQVQAAFLEMLMELDVDGIIVFGNDARKHHQGTPFPDTPDLETADRTDAAYFQLIADTVTRHGRRIVPAAGTPQGAIAVLQDAQ